jgi:hypothetical protein
MNHISRRSFIRNAALATSGVVITGGHAPFINPVTGNRNIEKGIKLFIPVPVQVVIDDVGWWSGEDGSRKQEPYRTGINRRHFPSDYQAIADLGRELGIRPQAAIILCEWDKENILRHLPTSTWMGDKWDNSKWVGPWLDEAAEIIRRNKAHLELTLHGIGHEYWENGTFTRAEWTDSKGHMRPADQVGLHLDYFEKLMNQHNLGTFPKSFVPAAFRHSFGPTEGNIVSLAEILKKRGVTYINTPFSSIYNKERIQYKLFGFDSGVMTVDRGRDEFSWTSFPGNPVRELKGPTCGMHWPNLLHPDPARNYEVVEKWINFLRPYNDRPDMLLAPDSEFFQHQLAHSAATKTTVIRNVIDIDFKETDKFPEPFGKNELIIRIQSDFPLKFRSKNIEIVSEALKKGDDFLYTLKLRRKEDRVAAQIKFKQSHSI